MHGNIARVKCTSCSYVGFDYSSPVCVALGGTEAQFTGETEGPDIPLEDLPRCPTCSELLRPGVVFFGEQAEYMNEIGDLLYKECDLLLVVGTSSMVNPAAIFAEFVRDQKGKVAVFNIEAPEATPKPSYDFLFLGPCEEMLVKALGVEELDLDGELAGLGPH